MHRFVDPLLGVFTGVLAFHLRQNDPKTAPPDDERLDSLLKWKYIQWKEKKRQREMAEDAELWASLPQESELVSERLGELALSLNILPDFFKVGGLVQLYLGGRCILCFVSCGI